jgi:hypothetical protein
MYFDAPLPFAVAVFAEVFAEEAAAFAEGFAFFGDDFPMGRDEATASQRNATRKI